VEGVRLLDVFVQVTQVVAPWLMKQHQNNATNGTNL
jgi:hypothetical protein